MESVVVWNAIMNLGGIAVVTALFVWYVTKRPFRDELKAQREAFTAQLEKIRDQSNRLAAAS